MRTIFAVCAATAVLVTASTAIAQITGAAPGQAMDLTAPLSPNPALGQSYAVPPTTGDSTVATGSTRLGTRLNARFSRVVSHRLNGGLDTPSNEALLPRDPRDNFESKRTSLETNGTLLGQPR